MGAKFQNPFFIHSHICAAGRNTRTLYRLICLYVYFRLDPLMTITNMWCCGADLPSSDERPGNARVGVVGGGWAFLSCATCYNATFLLESWFKQVQTQYTKTKEVSEWIDLPCQTPRSSVLEATEARASRYSLRASTIAGRGCLNSMPLFLFWSWMKPIYPTCVPLHCHWWSATTLGGQ